LTVDGEPSKGAAACCKAKWEYRHATIRFAVETVEAMDERELDECVVHELMHCLLNELREEDFDLKHEERVTTDLTCAVFFVLDSLVPEA
jgi:hypothetical protein